MRIFDEVVEAIELHIAQYPPERGGLLFGPIGRDVIVLFIPDDAAKTSSVSYTISKDMCIRTPMIEQETDLEYKGIIHSHPAYLDRPSSGDQVAATNALRANPQMARFYMPIVTDFNGSAKLLRAHEMTVRGGKISFFIALRRAVADSEADVQREVPYLIPVLDCLREACHLLNKKGLSATFSIQGSRISSNGILSLAYSMQCNKKQYIIMASELFPQYAPHVFYVDGTNEMQSIFFEWNINGNPGEQLSHAFEKTAENSFQITEIIPHIKFNKAANRRFRIKNIIRRNGRLSDRKF